MVPARIGAAARGAASRAVAALAASPDLDLRGCPLTRRQSWHRAVGADAAVATRVGARASHAREAVHAARHRRARRDQPRPVWLCGEPGGTRARLACAHL